MVHNCLSIRGDMNTSIGIYNVQVFKLNYATEKEYVYKPTRCTKFL